MANFNILEEDLIDANIYIVSEIGWEYNDEYFYRPESAGGTPINAFTIRQLAVEFCKTKDCEWFIGQFATKYKWMNSNPADYLNEDWYCNSHIDELVKDIDGLEWDGVRFICEDPKRLKFDQLHPLIVEIDLCRYEIIPVSLIA